jgi:AraC-like DNA-binding protein/uncharacterized cupin superfamily protein
MAAREPVPPPLKPIPPGQVVAYVATNTGPWRSKPHAHSGYELLYVSRGAKAFLINGAERKARAGDLIIFRPGDVHEEWNLSRVVSRMVIRCHADDLAAANAAFPPSDKLGAVVRLPWRQRFQHLFARMAEERLRPRPHSDLLLGAYLVEFVVLLSRAADHLASSRAEETEGDAARVRAAIEIIHHNLDRSLTLAELARSTFMSPSHFSHVFRAEAGEAPKRYLIRARIERAKQLLATTDLTVQQVAERLGYENPFYFYRLFKKKTGLTAGAFARRARKCIPRRADGHTPRRR